LSTPLDLVAMPTMAEAMSRAEQVNGDLRVLTERVNEQMARVGLARSLQTPDITVGGGMTFDAQPDFAVGWRFSAGATGPLFTPHRAGVVLEQAELARLRAEREATLATIAGGVAGALLQASAAAEQLTTYQRDILPLAQQDEAMAQEAYRAGQTGVDAL